EEQVGKGWRGGEEGWCPLLWGPWCAATGARLIFGRRLYPARCRLSDGETHSDDQGFVPSDPGLLWRGPITAGALRPQQTDLDPAASGTDPAPAPPPASGFHSLEGFSLRVTEGAASAGEEFALRVRAGGTASAGEEGVSHEKGMSSVAVSSAAASILGRARELRLARVINPAAAARACHLLSDGASAPALELCVYDAGRFPGSAAFLEGRAADGRGLLLVAVASSSSPLSPLSSAATASSGRGGGGVLSDREGEEGLAMVCFPHPHLHHDRHDRRRRHPCREGAEPGRGETDADGGPPGGRTVWSVTLFR
ncbi:unnamed protein product, partial [Laminaria digitata]